MPKLTIDIDAQIAALELNVGFAEGPNNENPWGPWQGVWNAAYCDSFAQWAAVVGGGFYWPDHCQFGYKGDAYCPYTEGHARELGLWRDAAYYQPQRGDQILFDWTGWGGCDHIGTVYGTDDDWATIWCIEGNTGSPNGVHYVRRDWKYVRGFVALSSVALTNEENEMNEDQEKKVVGYLHDILTKTEKILAYSEDQQKYITAKKGGAMDAAEEVIIQLLKNSGTNPTTTLNAREMAEAVVSEIAKRMASIE